MKRDTAYYLNEFIDILRVLRDLRRICTKSLKKFKGPCGPLMLRRLRNINPSEAPFPACT